MHVKSSSLNIPKLDVPRSSSDVQNSVTLPAVRPRSLSTPEKSQYASVPTFQRLNQHHMLVPRPGDKMTDENRTSVANFMAEHDPKCLAENIQSFCLAKDTKWTLAEKVREKYPNEFLLRVKILDLSSDERIAFAAERAEAAARDFAGLLPHLNLPEEVGVELSESLAQDYPELLAENIQNFNFQEHHRVALARLVAKDRPNTVAANIRNFDLSEQNRIEIATAIAEEDPEVLARFFRNFELDENRDGKKMLASLVGDGDPTALAENLGNFNLGTDDRLDLVRNFINENPRTIAPSIEHFDLPENDRIQMAELVAEKSLPTLARNIKNFGLPEDRRREYAKSVAGKNPEVFLKHVQNFDLPEEFTSELVRSAASRSVKPSPKLISASVEKLESSKEEGAKEGAKLVQPMEEKGKAQLTTPVQEPDLDLHTESSSDGMTKTPQYPDAFPPAPVKPGDLIYGLYKRDGGTARYVEEHKDIHTINDFPVLRQEMLFGVTGEAQEGGVSPADHTQFLETLKSHDKYKDAVNGNLRDNSAVRHKSKGGLYWATKVAKKDLHFALDGIDMNPVVKKSGALDHPKGPVDTLPEGERKTRALTGSELRWLYRNKGDPDVQKLIHFKLDDKPVPPPWEKHPVSEKDPGGREIDGPSLWAQYKPSKKT
jgi:thiol-disulfide isomerase/thioredoxin